MAGHPMTGTARFLKFRGQCSTGIAGYGTAQLTPVAKRAAAGATLRRASLHLRHAQPAGVEGGIQQLP